MHPYQGTTAYEYAEVSNKNVGGAAVVVCAALCGAVWCVWCGVCGVLCALSSVLWCAWCGVVLCGV
jgi:hypothetical protein